VRSAAGDIQQLQGTLVIVISTLLVSICTSWKDRSIWLTNLPTSLTIIFDLPICLLTTSIACANLAVM